MLSKGPYIEAEDLPLGAATNNGSQPTFYFPPQMKWSDLERAIVTTAMERAKGNKRAAAAALGMQRSRLYHKLSKYDIQVERQRKH